MRHRSLWVAVRAAAAAASGVIVAACIIQQEPQPQPMPGNAYQQGGAATAGDAGGALANGDYACSISSGGYTYPPFRCVVYTAENGGQVLEKMGGSQRFRGRVLADGAGFRFDGTFYCPYGDCTEDVSGTFAGSGQPGSYQGTLQGATSKNPPLQVSIVYQAGGMGYGGVAYGGAVPGGAFYGGARYGGARYAVPPPPPPVSR